jgi:hypothetical protein
VPPAEQVVCGNDRSAPAARLVYRPSPARS